MRRALAYFTLALALGAGSALAQDGAKPPPPKLDAKAEAKDGPSPRERWENLSDEDRARMRQRFEEFQRMSPDERRAVLERFDRMRALERGARDELSDERKRELSALDPQAQRDAMRGLVERDMCERGRAMREQMPHEWREAFERATPQERERMLAKFQDHMRGERAEHVLRDLARRLELPQAEVERIRALPQNEQAHELMGLERRAIEHDVETRGLPPWLSQDDWNTWRTLDTPQFIERWHSRQRQFGPPRPGPGSGPNAGPGPEGEGQRPPPGPPDGRHPDPERVRELFERLRPDPRWFNELSKLDPQARRETVEARLRERVLDWLEQSPDLIDPQALTRLKELHGREFLDRLRENLRDLPPPPFPPDGPGGPGGPGGPRPHDRGAHPPPPPPPGDHQHR